MVSEISAVARFGGRFIVLGDELGAVFSVADLKNLKRATQVPANFLPVMDDAEAASRDRDGNLWACTSHSCTKSGDRKESRELLVFKPSDASQRTQVCRDLRKQLLHAPNTPAVLAASESKAPEQAGVNIEGIAMVPSPYRMTNNEDDMLIVGFRAPNTNGLTGEALCAQVQFPRRLFGVGSIGLSFFSLPIGGGVRDLFWDDRTNRLLVLSGGVTDAGNGRAIHVVDMTKRRIEKRVAVADRTEAIVRDGDRIACLPDAPADGTVATWVEV